MSLAIVYSRASAGIAAPLVTVETHLSNGMAGLSIVGLPETAVKESKDRVRSALMNTHFEFPVRRITINLAPADLPKEGSRFDLPIALGILAASGQIPREALLDYELVGELALSGELRPVQSVLPLVFNAYQSGRQVIVPEANAAEASLVQQAKVFSAKHILDVCAHLQGERTLTLCRRENATVSQNYSIDMSDVKGQPHAKRALEIAAAGNHSMLLVGPPGTGKTMLANRLITILPPLSEYDALEVAAMTSISSAGFNPANWGRIPFRSPHHSSSSVALVGGGRPPRPGEISLAHRGILFLDELPEFQRHVLECLREPLESGSISISRAAHQVAYPAQFQFVAAMNPCPCGHAGSTTETCRCSPEQIQRYLGRLSGPLLDRMDMHIEVARIEPTLIMQDETPADEASDTVRARVMQARERQVERQGKINFALTATELKKYCLLDQKAQMILNQTMNKYHFSARVCHRIIKIARTIADLAGSASIITDHVSEALSYRALDRIKKVI
jgi:magnesium chelatase family protein